MTYSCKCQCSSFREHALGITFSSTAMPTRRPQVVETADTERRWDKDMPAYKRLRDDNLQPRHIDGSAELEARATDSIEVNKGHVFGKHLSLVKDAQDVVNEMRPPS
jgi:hypothetical protein